MLKEWFEKNREVPSLLGWLVTFSSCDVTLTSKLSVTSTMLHRGGPNKHSLKLMHKRCFKGDDGACKVTSCSDFTNHFL